jgi:hypothetical protein
MNRKIAELINEIAKECPYPDLISCEINNDFYSKCYIKISNRNTAPTAAFIKLLPYLGSVFGEGLTIEDQGNILIVS